MIQSREPPAADASPKRGRGVQGSGQNIVCHSVGFAAFVVTGFNITGAWRSSWPTGGQWCSGNAKCIYGYFVGQYQFGTPAAVGANYGVVNLDWVG